MHMFEEVLVLTAAGREMRVKWGQEVRFLALRTNQIIELALKAKHSFEHINGTQDVEVKYFHATMAFSYIPFFGKIVSRAFKNCHFEL